jgi:hypothetical protein
VLPERILKMVILGEMLKNDGGFLGVLEEIRYLFMALFKIFLVHPQLCLQQARSAGPGQSLHVSLLFIELKKKKY